MKNDKVVTLKNPGVPGEVQDLLTEILREGAQQLLAQAIESEVAEFLEQYCDARDDAGRRRMVRNGHLILPQFPGHPVKENTLLTLR